MKREAALSPTEFESYLDLLVRFLRLSAAQRDEIRRELRAHLDEALEDELAGGVSREEAVRRVLADFGDAAELAHRFHRPILRRRLVMQGAMAAACVGVLVLSVNLLSPGGTATVAADGPGEAATQREAPEVRAAAAGEDAARVASALSGRRGVRAGEDGEPAVQAAEAALQRVLPEVNFVNAPFEQVIEFVREATEVNLHVRWRALEDSGVGRDFPVSMRLKDISLERLLRLIFAEQTEAELGYAVEEGVIVISTRDNLRRAQSVVVYDVRTVVDWSLRGDAAGGARNAPEVGEEEIQEGADRLAELITTCVEPESWSANGGVGAIERVGSALVVRQSEAAHREIRLLLAELARAAGRPGAEK